MNRGLPLERAPICPIVNAPTLPVSLVTVGQHTSLPTPTTASFGFCDAPACDVVYVGSDGALIRKDQLRTRVGIKETEEPIPVCYCFGFTARLIADDLLASGRSTIQTYIQEQVREGHCHCEVTNPSGRCCLGQVGRTVAGIVGSPSA